jgi:hypothetical protein
MPLSRMRILLPQPVVQSVYLDRVGCAGEVQHGAIRQGDAGDGLADLTFFAKSMSSTTGADFASSSVSLMTAWLIFCSTRAKWYMKPPTCVHERCLGSGDPFVTWPSSSPVW